MKLYHSSNFSVPNPDTSHSRDFMTDESRMALRAAKCANIIMSICDLYGTSLKDSTDIFYKSVTAGMIEDGVSDLNCRSDKYLASLVWDEYQESLK